MAGKKKEQVVTEPIDTFEEKKKAVGTAMAQLQKKYGAGAVMYLGNSVCNVEAAPSGIMTLDLALGVGGIPKGRIMEIFGPESSGKTTIALTMIATAQARGEICAFIDTENAIDPKYAQDIGVNKDELILSQPDNGEQAIEIAKTLISSGGVSLVVIDSVTGLIPKAELEADFEAVQMGNHAKLMSKAARELAPLANKTGTTVLFTNQLREKVGFVMGNPEVTTGGRALKFFSTIRMDIRSKDGSKNSSGEVIGKHATVKIVKNKVASPYKRAEFDIIFGKGVDKTGEIADIAAMPEFGIIQASGAWYKYNGQNIAQGRDNLKAYLDNNPEFKEEVTTKIYEIMKERAEKAAAEAAENESEELDENLGENPVADGEGDGYDL